MDDTRRFWGSNQSRYHRQAREIWLLKEKLDAERRWYRLWLMITLMTGCLIGAGLAWAVGMWFR